MQPHGKSDTGVDAGRNHAVLKIAEPARSRVRLLAARGLAVLILAFAGLLALPLQAQAQKTTFVSNTGQSTATSLRGIGPTGIGSFFYSQAQRFSTGSNEGGYTLSAIKVQADNFESASSPRVSIYTVTSDNPGTLLYVLTNPATLNDDAINTFRAPANATLEEDTNYFVVFEALGSGSNLRYDLKGTVSANEDSGTASGWSIADTSRERATNSGNWSSVFARLKIAVRGTIPPAISIADASAAENAGHLLFDVTLSRALPNTVKVDFETISGGTATEGVDYYARRTYTHVILAGDKTAQMGFALIEDTVAAAGETVKVKLSNARVVDAYGDKIKDLDITRAEAMGTIDAPPTTTTNVPGLTIGIRDATGDEDDGWLDFRVKLSRKYTDYVCYDFETISGGTATEGRDYSKRPKVGGWVQIGKRVDKPFVRIIDDSIDDDGETVKVKISNARLCNDPSKTLSITRAEATGTITNSDHMPKAWLARFGRTVAEQVLDAVGARVEGNSNSPGPAQLTLGGHQVVLDASWSRAEDTLLGEAGVLGQDLRDVKDLLRAEADASPESEISTAGFLMASSFHMASAGGEGEDESGRWSLWARGSRSSFSGREDALTLEGDVLTGVMGADYERGRVLAGVALAYSTGEGSYTEADARGEVESTLLSAYPYLRYTLSERLSVWGVLGLGEGGLTLDMKANENANDEHIETDVSLAMAAFGARGKLASVAGYDLAVKTDVLFVRTESEAATGLAAADARTRRLRLALEGSREVKLDGGVLTPSLEIGLRHDGGDAETGSGLELGGGLRWAGLKGFSVEVRARGLLAHEERDYEEWGVSASLGLSPGEGGRGLSMRVGSVWGADSGGVERLWSQRALAGSSFDPDARLEAEVGYGLDAMRGLLTPYTGVALSSGGESWRAGARFRFGERFTMSLEGDLKETEQGDGPVHGVALRGSLRW